MYKCILKFVETIIKLCRFGAYINYINTCLSTAVFLNDKYTEIFVDTHFEKIQKQFLIWQNNKHDICYIVEIHISKVHVCALKFKNRFQ